MSLENFKKFVQTKPSLVSYVKNNQMTWQKFYEMYNLYGENNSIWNEYNANYTEKSSEASFKQMFSTIKNMDLESVQSGIGNIQKGITLLQDLFVKDKKESTREPYEPRPMNRYFDD